MCIPPKMWRGEKTEFSSLLTNCQKCVICSPPVILRFLWESPTNTSGVLSLVADWCGHVFSHLWSRLPSSSLTESLIALLGGPGTCPPSHTQAQVRATTGGCTAVHSNFPRPPTSVNHQLAGPQLSTHWASLSLLVTQASLLASHFHQAHAAPGSSWAYCACCCSPRPGHHCAPQSS